MRYSERLLSRILLLTPAFTAGVFSIDKEMLVKASKCKSVEELISLAEAEGFEITKDEAEAYMAEMENCEMDEKDLDKVAGGDCYAECNKDACPLFGI